MDPINVASWVVGKALAPAADSVLGAWAASAGLHLNVEALTTELLQVQATLDGSCGREKDNPKLEELFQKLRDLAYDAGDVLDELDYFRIQDELDGTSEAVSEQSLAQNARHTARAFCNPIRAIGVLIFMIVGFKKPVVSARCWIIAEVNLVVVYRWVILFMMMGNEESNCFS